MEPIDFDIASKYWRQNKIAHTSIAGFRGNFRYRCGHEKVNGEPCNNYPIRKSKKNPHALSSQGWGPCRIHKKYYPEMS